MNACYRMLKETLAIFYKDDKPILLTIQVGSIVTLREPPSKATGMARVEWDGRSGEIFAIDLQERGEPIGRSRSHGA